MGELLHLLATSLSFLLEPGRYRIVDSQSSTSFGNASVTLESASLRLELVRDRSEVSLRFQGVEAPSDEWFWIGIARRLLNGDRPGSDQLDDSAIAFLREHVVALETGMADNERQAELRKDLTATQEERARELFGGPSG